MILFLHNRYRTTGGEERAVDDLMWLVEDRLHERVRMYGRDSGGLSRARAARSLLRGGEGPTEVAAAVRQTGARVVHAHNLHPLLGWRALAAAREAGAKVVLHLHQYRLVCAVGVCFTGGERCTRCHGRNTLPGILRNCRGSRPEAISYAAALALWQQRLAAQADAVIVPSVFALGQLRKLGAPLDFERVQVLAPPLRSLSERQLSAERDSTGHDGGTPADRHGDAPADQHGGAPADRGGYALVVSRLAVEKGIELAIDACRLTGRPLLVAGDGPERERLRHYADGHDVRFLGAVSERELAALRAKAALALVPSRSDETFGIAAAEAMAAELPVLATNVGALPELLERDALVSPGDSAAMAEGIERLWGDMAAGRRNRERIGRLCAPRAVAGALGRIYDGVCAA